MPELVAGVHAAALPIHLVRAAEDMETGARSRSRTIYLLPAFLDKGPHEVFGVLLEHLVDLVEDRVDVLVDLVLALLGRLIRLDFGDVLVFGGLPRPVWTAVVCLLGPYKRMPTSGRYPMDTDRYPWPPWPPRPAHPPVIALTRSSAVRQRSSRSPTCARVPRSGSRVGTRCSDS
jgi:hypothetical protein